MSSNKEDGNRHQRESNQSEIHGGRRVQRDENNFGHHGSFPLELILALLIFVTVTIFICRYARKCFKGKAAEI
jgi:hypothetical protein